MAKWTVICLGLVACGGTDGPQHPAPGKHDGIQDAAPMTHDAAAHDASVDASTKQPMMSAADAAADGAAATTCADQTLAIAQTVFDAIKTADVTNHCTTDADCVTAQPLHNSCYDGCTLPLSSNGVTVVELELKTLERKTCPAFTQSGCTVDQPMCQPPPPVNCQDGRCVVPAASQGQRCENLSGTISDRIAQSVALADRGCLVDTDCTVMSPGNACFSDCTQQPSLSLAGAASVQKAVDAAAAEICPAFFGLGCQLNLADCGTPKMRARCLAKTCAPIPTL